MTASGEGREAGQGAGQGAVGGRQGDAPGRDGRAAPDGVGPAARDGSGVFRRTVLYIPGYDPFPPRRYRELYRREGARQAAISGYDLRVTALDGDRGAGNEGTDGGAGDYGWRVAARMPDAGVPPGAALADSAALADGGAALTRVSVLVWGDIVRASMRQGIAATYAQMLRTAWIYLSSGALWRLMRLRRGPILAALYPFAVLLAQAVLALALGALAGRALHLWLGPAPAALAAVLVAWAFLRACRAMDRRIYAYYLMHDYAFAAGGQGAYPPALEAFIDRSADRIAAALAEPVDEVLVIGHSAGAHLAVSALARLLRGGVTENRPENRPEIALLTLGQAVPMLSFLPRADRLRADLHDLAAEARVFWLDVTAPADGCSFALCDPVAVSGVAPDDRHGPLVVSAAFSQTLSPARWRALRRRYLRLHFQYLCAFDRPGHYDYFRLTAGPLSLAHRYRGHAPSPSRIETPLSGYRSRAGAAPR